MPELPKLLQRVRKYRGRLRTRLGLRLLFLTGVRTGELLLSTPDQFHLDKGLWIIPPDVVKQLQVHMRKKRQKPQDIPPYSPYKRSRLSAYGVSRRSDRTRYSSDDIHRVE